MAFGLAPAPRVFTKLLKVVVAVLRKRGIRLVIYLDDLLFLNSTKDGVQEDLRVALELLQRLGFLINWKKSVLIPTQIIEYLGLVVDSINLPFSLPDDKVLAVQRMCHEALDAGRVSLRNIASILGNFNWAIPTIPFAQSHYRSMQRFYINETRKAIIWLQPTANNFFPKSLTWRSSRTPQTGDGVPCATGLQQGALGLNPNVVCTLTNSSSLELSMPFSLSWAILPGYLFESILTIRPPSVT